MNGEVKEPKTINARKMKNKLLSGIFDIDISKMSREQVAERIKMFIRTLHPDRLKFSVQEMEGKADSKLYHIATHLLSDPEKMSERYEEILFVCRCARDIIASPDAHQLYCQAEILCEMYTIITDPEKVMVEKVQAMMVMLSERFKNIEFRLGETHKQDNDDDEEDKIDPLVIVKRAVEEFEPLTSEDMLDGEKSRHVVKRFRSDLHGQDNFKHCSLCNNDIETKAWKTTCMCKDWYHLECMFKFWEDTTKKSTLSLSKRVVTIKCPNTDCSFASTELKYMDV